MLDYWVVFFNLIKEIFKYCGIMVGKKTCIPMEYKLLDYELKLNQKKEEKLNYSLRNRFLWNNICLNNIRSSNYSWNKKWSLNNLWDLGLNYLWLRFY